MDFLRVINELITHLNDVDWYINDVIARPSLNGYTKQNTELELLPIEYIQQQGNGDYGFGGIIYFPTEYSDGDGGNLFIEVYFSG